MKKRLIAFITLLVFLFPTTAFAFDMNRYYNDIKVGLENMLSPSITVTMLGNYTSSGNVYPSGTSFMLNFDNSQINMNGTLYNELTFTPSTRDDLIRLRNGVKEYSFKGTMTFKISGSNIIPVNTINIEDYLKGIVPYEMSNSYPIEALKAQAVAARNYAVINIGKHGSEGYDICDTTDCQVYRGYNPAYANAIRAVDETNGILLMFNDDAAGCFYGASNGGWTEASKNVWYKDLSYLQALKDDFDSEVWSSGDRKLTSADVQAILKNKGYLLSTDTFVKIDTDTITYFESGRISNITIFYNDMNGNLMSKSFSKEGARTFLGMPSALYTVSYDQMIDTYTFSGKGSGNGVGLSQIGAKNRAYAGQTFDQILSFYYPGTVIKGITARINNISRSRDSVTIGEDITLGAVMDGNASGSLLFKYIIEKDGKAVYVRDYDYNSQITYKPSEAGIYTARLFVRDITSQKEFDEQAMTGFNVYTLPTITGISLNPVQAVPNKPLTVNIDVSGGSSAGYDVTCEVKKDGITLFSNTGSNTFTFTPDKEGQIVLNVKVKDRLSLNTFDSEKSLNINVNTQKEPEPSRGDTPSFSISRTLKLGVSGSDVSALQNALGKLGFYTYG
jgi:stage II sporulation protein D